MTEPVKMQHPESEAVEQKSAMLPYETIRTVARVLVSNMRGSLCAVKKSIGEHLSAAATAAG
jgi:hypothetical protein